MRLSTISALVALLLVAGLALVGRSADAGFAVHAGVERSTAELATQSQRAAFSESVVKAIANMMLATGGEPTDAELAERAKNLGVVSTIDVAEVNDTFTNVQLDCELQSTQMAVLEQANVESWNALKSTGIVLASDKGPEAETQGARTVVFFAIVTIVAVVCAGLASWFVRRRAIEQHRGIYFPDLTSLEEELFNQQADEAPLVAAQKRDLLQQQPPATPSASTGGRGGGTVASPSASQSKLRGGNDNSSPAAAAPPRSGSQSSRAPGARGAGTSSNAGGGGSSRPRRN